MKYIETYKYFILEKKQTASVIKDKYYADIDERDFNEG